MGQNDSGSFDPVIPRNCCDSAAVSTDDSRPISLFIPSLDGGGAQKVIVNLANSIVKMTDRPVHVVLVKLQGPFLKELSDDICVVDLKAGRTLTSIMPLAKYLKSSNPVAFMSTLNYANVVATISHLIAGRPTRLVLREANIRHQPVGSFTSRTKTILLHTAMRFTYAFADLIVANSTDTRDSLLNCKIVTSATPVVIPNPVVVSASPVNQEIISSSTTLLPDKPFLCAIGRLTYQKGFDTLIQAFASVESKEHDLVILGKGELETEFLSIAEEYGVRHRIHLPGFIQPVSEWLALADLFVLSSRWEGFGNVLVEALAAGVPIVSTNALGGPRDILNHGEFGHLCPVDDHEEMAKAISDALQNPRSTAALRRARAEVYSSDTIAREYLREVFLLGEEKSCDNMS